MANAICTGRISVWNVEYTNNEGQACNAIIASYNEDKERLACGTLPIKEIRQITKIGGLDALTSVPHVTPTVRDDDTPNFLFEYAIGEKCVMRVSGLEVMVIGYNMMDNGTDYWIRNPIHMERPVIVSGCELRKSLKPKPNSKGEIEENVLIKA